jgi:hypothetical protein
LIIFLLELCIDILTSLIFLLTRIYWVFLSYFVYLSYPVKYFDTSSKHNFIRLCVTFVSLF